MSTWDLEFGEKIYDSKCLRFVDWLLEARPSFSPPRRDLRPADSDPGATQYYSQRLDNLNTKYDRLLEQLSQRLKTAIEVNGSDGLVSNPGDLILNPFPLEGSLRGDVRVQRIGSKYSIVS